VSSPKRNKSRFFRDIKYLLLNHIGVPILILLLKILSKTWKIEWGNEEVLDNLKKNLNKRFIAAFWHSDMISILAAGITQNTTFPLTILISPSRDGEILAKIVTKLGFMVKRGSSAKNAIGGLKVLKMVLEENGCVAIAVDGPKGPRYSAKSGTILLSKLTQAPILIVGANISRKFIFKSWDKCELPLPFSRIKISLNNLIYIPKESTKEEIEKYRKELEKILLEIKHNSYIVKKIKQYKG